MMAIYAIGMASLVIAGISSAAVQSGEDGFLVFFCCNLGAFLFFICLVAIFVKMFRDSK